MRVVSLFIIWMQLFQTAVFALHFSEIEHRYSSRANDFVDFYSNGTELHRDLKRRDGLPVISSVCCLEECSEEDCPAMHSFSKRFSSFTENFLNLSLSTVNSDSSKIVGKLPGYFINILHIAPKNSPPQ